MTLSKRVARGTPRHRQRTTDRVMRKTDLRTRCAAAARAGRIVRVVGVMQGAAWSLNAPVFTAKDMAQWCRRMERADRSLRSTTVMWAPRGPCGSLDHTLANKSAEFAGGPPVHMLSVHMHGRICARRGAVAYSIAHRTETVYKVAELVRQLHQWFQPRKIVLFVCYSAVNYVRIPTVPCPVWAAEGEMVYSADHEAWEQRGCPTRDRTEWFPNSVVARTMRRVQ